MKPYVAYLSCIAVDFIPLYHCITYLSPLPYSTTHQCRRSSDRYDERCVWSFSSVKWGFYDEENVWAKHESKLTWWHHTRWSMCVSVALLSLTITNLILLKYIFLNESLLIHRMLFLQTSLSLFLSVANGHILFHLHFTSLFLFSKYLPSSILNLKS